MPRFGLQLLWLFGCGAFETLALALACLLAGDTALHHLRPEVLGVAFALLGTPCLVAVGRLDRRLLKTAFAVSAVGAVVSGIGLRLVA